MELYIKIFNGLPHEHPIVKDNFQQAFPNIDVNNLPSEFARFERVACPNNAGVYEINEVSYQWVDGVVKDVWTVRAMTVEEKTAKIEQAMATKPFPSWVFDEVTCSFNPPIPYPTGGKRYRWDEPSLSWVEVPTQGA